LSALMREACVTRFYAPGDPVDDGIPHFARLTPRADLTRVAAWYLIESREYTRISRMELYPLQPRICFNNTCFFLLFLLRCKLFKVFLYFSVNIKTK